MTRPRPEIIPAVTDVVTRCDGILAVPLRALRIWGSDGPGFPCHHRLRAYGQRAFNRKAAQRPTSLVVPLGGTRSPVCPCNSYPLAPNLRLAPDAVMALTAGIKDISKGFTFPRYQGESGFKKIDPGIKVEKMPELTPSGVKSNDGKVCVSYGKSLRFCD